ncbi:uncharacterized protein ARMOST_02185 [Armillaria ostoyae]|uniref:Uncharacterized protein n=1 Tax=Armillaria ostoyae TaxID=47428 RepID=A0A284QR06_ARMOS|nr:uncharacterized protein ARMOST_02185 [Armillaria ostoyae]
MIGVKIQTERLTRFNGKASIVEDDVHNGKKGASQMITASHFIVTAEQLFKYSGGHFSQFGLIVRDNGFCCFRRGKKRWSAVESLRVIVSIAVKPERVQKARKHIMVVAHEAREE